MAIEIVLDTETTGIDPKRGHRLVEIGCLEIEDLMPTGRHFHEYINPERDIEADAVRVHGISNEMVANKPKFKEISEKLLDFLGDRQIVAHNADFDRGFVNMEFERLNIVPPPATQWTDTLAIARKKFPGMANSLDALCKRFNISLVERDKHGALLDARLLSAVYLELLGGKERGLDLEMVSNAQSQFEAVKSYGQRPRPLPSRITEAEALAHQEFVKKYLKDKALW